MSEITGQTTIIPYASVEERRSWLKVDADLKPTLTTVTLRKIRVWAGPYVVTIWEAGALGEECSCFRIQQAGCPKHG